MWHRHPTFRLVNAVTAALAAAVLPVSLVGLAGPAGAAQQAAGTPLSAAAPASPAAPVDRGGWQVTPAGPGSWTVSWRSPARLPLTSDRPTVVAADADAAGLRIGAPTVAADGRTVSALVDASSPPTAQDFDVLLSGDRLDVAGDDRAEASAPTGRGDLPLTPRQAPEIAVDLGEPGDLDTTTSEYTLESVKLPGIREPIEMVGHVVEPAEGELAGPAPLVLFQHGRYATCYEPDPGPQGGEESWPCRDTFEEIPSHLGYDYIQQLLASQGYVTVSVRVNGINAQDIDLPDSGANARATIVQRHLDHWAGIAAEHQVDLSQVVLVGHSRGGEGVNRASVRIPLSAPYRVVGQVLIAPTNFASQTAPYVPTVTLLPSCDGDVVDLQGQRFTDYSRDLLPDDTSLKSSVFVVGANHNYFNTEWTPDTAVAPAEDDWFGEPDQPCGRDHPDRLSAGEQRDVGAAYVAGAVRLFTGEGDALPMFDGSRVEVPSIGEAIVLSHALGGGREVRRSALDTALTLADGASTSFCRGVAVDGTDLGACGQQITDQVVTPHWTTTTYEQAPSRRFFEMSWDAVGQRGGLALDKPLDLTGDRLELRTLVDPRVGPVELGVRLTDAAGASVEVTPQGGGVLAALPPALPKIWGQTLIVDPAGAGGIDISRVNAVELVARNATGRIWVADLSAAPSTLAPVPAQRAASIDLGTVRVPEGDGSGTVTARVPFTVQGALTRPGRLVIAAAGSDEEKQDRFTVDIAPGQTSGLLPPLTYESNDVDDLRRGTQFTAYATRGLTTDSYLGNTIVVDDDPTPGFRFAATPRTVAEGEPLTFRLTLDEPVGYTPYPRGRIVRGRSPELQGDDLTEQAREDLGVDDDLTLPLSSSLSAALLGPYVSEGSTTATVQVPTLDDDVAEGRESITVRLSVPTGDGVKRFTRTAYVAASDGG